MKAVNIFVMLAAFFLAVSCASTEDKTISESSGKKGDNLEKKEETGKTTGTFMDVEENNGNTFIIVKEKGFVSFFAPKSLIDKDSVCAGMINNKKEYINAKLELHWKIAELDGTDGKFSAKEIIGLKIIEMPKK